MYASQNMEPQPKPPAQPAPPPPPKPVPQPPPPPMPQPAPNQPPPAAVPASAAVTEESANDAPSEAAAAENTPPKRKYTGFIRVHVTTAEGARPVPHATVMITRMIDGEPELISVQDTDQSGNTQKVTVPAPPPSEDQRHPESYHYDISVNAHDFYREHSTDVPVFPNITSVQNFNLIPLPAGTDEPTPGGDITFYNNMPQY